MVSAYMASCDFGASGSDSPGAPRRLGVRMVAIVDIAVMAARYDTAVAAAFRRALVGAGVSVAIPHAWRPEACAPLAGDTYDGIEWCFQNDESPMDAMWAPVRLGRWLA